MVIDWRTDHDRRALLGLGACLILPSLGEVHKYTGLVGTGAYLVASATVLWIVLRSIYPWFLARVTEKQAIGLGVLTLLGLVVVFALVFPYADSGAVGGGSDADDALNIAATELFHGRSPYGQNTYLGNPTGRLPGSIFFAAPFVLLGDSAYQSVFWLMAFFLAVWFVFRDALSAVFLLWLVCGLSPLVMQLLVTGNDRLANTIYVVLLTLLVVNEVPRRGGSAWRKVLAAVLLGLALIARANFILVLPLIFSSLVQSAGWRPAIRYVAVTGLAMGAALLPFYLWDPSGFMTTVFSQTNKVGRFGAVVPHAGLLIGLATGLTALALSLQRTDARHVVLMRNCAIVQVIPVALSFVFELLASGRPSNYYFGYGMHFMFFGVWAAWTQLAPGLAAPARDAVEALEARGLPPEPVRRPND